LRRCDPLSQELATIIGKRNNLDLGTAEINAQTQ
jgi:hypothetical protein